MVVVDGVVLNILFGHFFGQNTMIIQLPSLDIWLDSWKKSWKISWKKMFDQNILE